MRLSLNWTHLWYFLAVVFALTKAFCGDAVQAESHSTVTQHKRVSLSNAMTLSYKGTVSRDFRLLREFSKKFETVLLGYSGAGRETDS